ncbi:invasin [Salmonella enterica subsp. enterica serovar Typhimurium]|nr:invasin [Salmonella enterica subsp. enterica serovar Typhimurium]
MDGCSASIRFWMPTSVIPTCVAALAGKSIKTVWPFPATIISLSPAGKWSAAHELHDERPAYGFDLRTKGTLPDFPWFSGELTYEQYYGDKVDLLGNGTLSRNPRAAGAALVWNPVPLLEVRAGYRDAGNGGSQAEGGLRVNYSFGTPLHEQLDYRNVGAPSNTTNRRAFVDRNYDIVMAYREQASKIRITAMPVSGLSGTLVTLMATVDSRYPG